MYIPRTYRDAKDLFSYILANAPDFQHAPTKRPLTLDDVMNGLVEGIRLVSAKTNNQDALRLFRSCEQQVLDVHNHYREGRLREARLNIQTARDTFAAAGKAARSKDKASEEWGEKR